IGGGLFVERSGAHGYDVNPEAVQWLKRRGSYRHPESLGPQTLTFWDSLEHIPDPVRMVQCAKQWVAVSMPIYESAEAVLSSPHYKPGEHLWYWTHEGLIQWFRRRGFECREHNTMETILGRRGIHSYMFERVGE
ncbi:methyltransferase domain-containing protein, partial [Photobacterium sanguinicancri]